MVAAFDSLTEKAHFSPKNWQSSAWGIAPGMLRYSSINLKLVEGVGIGPSP